MKRLLTIIICIFMTMTYGCSKKRTIIQDYKIEEIPSLIELAYKDYYGLDVTVENLIGGDYAIENDENKRNYLYEISIDNSFYHFYETHQLSPERDIIKNLEDYQENFVHFKEIALFTEKNKDFIGSMITSEFKSLFWFGGKYLYITIALADKDKVSDEYYEDMSYKLSDKYDDSYKEITINFVFVENLSQIKNNLYLEFYGMRRYEVNQLIDTTIPHTRLTYTYKEH